MAYMTEKEFSSKLKRLQIENEQREKIRTLKKEKWKHFPKFKLPSTSKLVVLVVFLLCIEAALFAEKNASPTAVVALLSSGEVDTVKMVEK